MRSICLLLVALAFLSVANQKHIGLGEFVAGHELAQNKFRILGSNKANQYRDYLSANTVLAIAKGSSVLELQGPCGICTSTAGKAPVCVKKICQSWDQFNAIKDILFGRNDASKVIWRISSNSLYPYRVGNNILWIRRQ